MTIYRKQRKDAPRGRSVYGAAQSAQPAPDPAPAAPAALTADDMLEAYAPDGGYDAYAAHAYASAWDDPGQYSAGENNGFSGGVIMPEEPAFDAAPAAYGYAADMAGAPAEPVAVPGVTEAAAGPEEVPAAAPTDFLGAVEEASRALGAEPAMAPAEPAVELTDVTVESTDGVPLDAGNVAAPADAELAEGAEAAENAPVEAMVAEPVVEAAEAAEDVPTEAAPAEPAVAAAAMAVDDAAVAEPAADVADAAAVAPESVGAEAELPEEAPIAEPADAAAGDASAAPTAEPAPSAPELTEDTPVGTTPALFSPDPDEAAAQDAPKKKPARRTRSRRKKDAEPAPHRTASVHRATGETDIQIDLDLDGTGAAEISTGVPFFDHMLNAFARHGLFNLTVQATGDVEVDAHHTVEDTGIVLGQAFAEALGDKRGVTRFADVAVPLDEALVQAVVDLSGRGQAYCTLPLPTERVGAFDTELAVEFFYAFARDARATLHVRELAGANSHHIIEAAFKAAGRAMRRACELDPRVTGIPSTKGSL